MRWPKLRGQPQPILVSVANVTPYCHQKATSHPFAAKQANTLGGFHVD